MKQVRASLLVVCALVMSPGSPVRAQEEPGNCVELGALAWDDWTAADAGGAGLPPAGVVAVDYLRCAACHGWDRLGTDGGSARQARSAGSPNAGAGDGDQRPRSIPTGSATEQGVRHAGSGRRYDEGAGSWVPLEEPRSAANTAAHAAGFTLGNQHPDFSSTGPNGPLGVPSDLQVGCLVEFLNYADGDAGRVFSRIDTQQDPVAYTMVAEADAGRGEALYESVCEECHVLQNVLDFLEGDGAFSELAHKLRWGIPDTTMGRRDMGDPTALEVADLLLYLQQLGGQGFRLNPGLTGTWWNANRAGEGFLLEFAFQPGSDDLTLFASFYTYDPTGDQAWLVAQPATPIDAAADGVDVQVFLVRGPAWGEAFDPADRDVMTWGSGRFRFPGCGRGEVSLTPSPEAEAMGFTALSYALTRDLLDSGIECPTPTAN